MGVYATIHSLLWATRTLLKHSTVESPIMDTNGADKIFRGCKSGPWGGPFRELSLILGCLIMGPTARLSELGLLLHTGVSINYVMFHQLPLIYFYFALEAHSVIEKGRRLVNEQFFELWNEDWDGILNKELIQT